MTGALATRPAGAMPDRLGAPQGEPVTAPSWRERMTKEREPYRASGHSAAVFCGSRRLGLGHEAGGHPALLLEPLWPRKPIAWRKI
jgi:hypothetical protein